MSNTDIRRMHATSVPETTDDELREVAVKRVKAKRDFMTHLFAYVVVNIGLWVIWIVGGFTDEWVFPWPAIVMAIWGMFVLRQWFEVYRRDPLREDLVQREMEQLRTTSRAHPLD